jgi:branched-chain amino acid transport system ATP-binding protein
MMTPRRNAQSTSRTSEHAVSTLGSEPILKVEDLVVGYGAMPVITGISLEVRRGEIVALLGPNGAGKSTTLAAIVGDLTPQAGKIWWNGGTTTKPVHGRAREGLAFVMEGRSVIASLSVADNLKLGRGPVEKALEITPELKRLLKRKAGLLSGGEQQMLSLTRALAGDPSVLMVDELSLGLAPIIVDRLMRTLQAAADRGVGVLIVEQHVRKALQVSERLYVLRHGEIALAADASQYRDRHDAIENLYLSSAAS